jgi:hypothetical protein
VSFNVFFYNLSMEDLYETEWFEEQN